MRIVIAAAGVVVLLVLGMVGLVVHHESGKQPIPVASGTAGAKVETISRGEAVDIAAHTTGGQWTVIEFTADW